MRLVEGSNTEVSGAYEVPQSRGKSIFLKSSSCVFAQKFDRDRSKYESTSDKYVAWSFDLLQSSLNV